MNRQKVTPLHDKSWYLKWLSSIFLISAIIARSSGANEIDIYLSLMGVSGWFVVGMWWHDRSLILLNGVSVVILVVGIV